jgi:hypothetical protein
MIILLSYRLNLGQPLDRIGNLFRQQIIVAAFHPDVPRSNPRKNIQHSSTMVHKPENLSWAI